MRFLFLSMLNMDKPNNCIDVKDIYYNGNQWEMSESGIGLQKKISNQILNIFCESGGEIYKEMGIDVKSNQSLYLAKQKETPK